MPVLYPVLAASAPISQFSIAYGVRLSCVGPRSQIANSIRATIFTGGGAPVIGNSLFLRSRSPSCWHPNGVRFFRSHRGPFYMQREINVLCGLFFLIWITLPFGSV